MNSINKIFRGTNLFHIFIGALLVIYIISNVRLPHEITRFVDSTIGNIVVIVLAVILLLSTHPVVGILGIVAAYELIRRSTNGFNLSGEYYDAGVQKQEYIKEKKRYNLYPRYNDFPVTLEEEVVQNMAPLVKHDSPSSLNYKPAMSNTYDATPL